MRRRGRRGYASSLRIKWPQSGLGSVNARYRATRGHEMPVDHRSVMEMSS